MKLRTPIKVETFSQWLVGYNAKDRKFLLDGFTEGFKIPYEGPRKFRYSENLVSALQNLDILKSKILKEVQADRAAGPFQHIPFPNIQISPLGLVPKKVKGEFRVIHHLSYPEKFSINDGIPDDLSTVQYQTIDHAISLVKFPWKKLFNGKN